MPTLLHLDSSADLITSRTRLLTREFSDAWSSRGTDFEVVVRDLHLDPLPHLRVTAQHWPERLRDGAAVPADLDALQQTVIDELLRADVIVVGAPMYNYGIPSTLKAWVDLIHVPGVTAPFDEATQPMAGRLAVIVTARGGIDAPDERTVITGPLATVFEGGLGMEIAVITTSRTLADRIPDLDRELAAAELEAARRLAISTALAA
jgi:FMN-dependent NADH-azoreductase